MTWVFYLSIAVIVAVGAWLTQIKPSGTKKIRGTRLMAVGRVFLLALVAILVLLAAKSALAHEAVSVAVSPASSD